MFNAVVASGIPAERWTAGCDTVAFCFSKGLGAPVGSIVCGDRPTIERAHRFRKMFGGGMRQAGVIAAAAAYALDHNVERLADDHANARRLAEGLGALGLRVDPAPQTNIVLFRHPRDNELLAALKERGVLVNLMGKGVFRAVTHLDVDGEAIEEAIERCREALSSLPPAA